MLAVNTDYLNDTDCPRPYLERIAAAGFRQVHWVHHWDTNHLYDDAGVREIAGWLDDYGLELCGIHGSTGDGALWSGKDADARRPGVELVVNRLEMAARLGTDVVVLHLPRQPDAARARARFWERASSSLDALQVHSQRLGVHLALENLPWFNDTAIIAACRRYPPDFLGLCYDSGHGYLSGTGLTTLAQLADRLLAIHLHDNDGSGDQHRLPFRGGVDWPELIAILRRSAYGGPLNLECKMPDEAASQESFLADVREAGERLQAMRARPGGTPG